MFKFSKKSIEHLYAVDRRLVLLARNTIKRTPRDFAIISGVRTADEQMKLYNSGASQTLMSKHMVGRAFDFVPYVGGSISWAPDDFVPVLDAFRDVAIEMNLSVRSGAAWHVNNIATLGTTSMAEAMSEYIELKGDEAFVDPGHLELSW